jgi:hypothetical protein
MFSDEALKLSSSEIGLMHQSCTMQPLIAKRLLIFTLLVRCAAEHRRDVRQAAASVRRCLNSAGVFEQLQNNEKNHVKLDAHIIIMHYLHNRNKHCI